MNGIRMIRQAAVLIALSCSVCGQQQELPAQPESLVPNPGLEQGRDQPDAWSFYSWEGAEGWWDSEVARSGRRSLGMKGLNGGWSANVDVEPGSVYSLRFHCRAEGPPSRVVLFVREVRDGRIGDSIVYKPAPTVPADQQGGFVEGTYVEGAEEGGWAPFEGGDFSPGEGVDALNILIKIRSDSLEAQVWLDDIVLTEREPVVIEPTARLLGSLPDCTVWTDSVNRKMLPEDGPPGGDPLPAIEVKAARGEYECFQVALTPTTAIAAVDWEWSGFAGPGELPAQALTCRLIECIPIERTRSPYEHKGLNPDALTDRLPVDLAAGTTQGFWFSLKVPAEQAPGGYASELVLRSSDQEQARVPVKLTVWDFAIPRRPSLGVRSSFRAPLVQRREAGEWGEVLARYYGSFFEHRTRCTPAVRVDVRLNGDAAEVDADEFIRQVRMLRDEHGLERLDMPSLWVSHRETHRMPADAEWEGRRIFANEQCSALNPEFEQPFRSYFGKLCSRLREGGLFLRPVVRFFDEPHLDDAVTRNGLRVISELLLDIEPEVTVAIAASDPHPELTGVVRQWVIHTDAWGRVLPRIEAAREAGCEVHVYNNAVNWPSQRRLRVRLWPWMLWEYGVDGTYSWWGSVCWRGDLEDPWIAGGGEFSGILLYPPRTPEEHGPIESVRWELFREGLEDYEYLRLASESGERGEQAVAAAMELVDRWPNVRAGNDEPYCLDPAKVEAAREALAEAIEAGE